MPFNEAKLLDYLLNLLKTILFLKALLIISLSMIMISVSTNDFSYLSTISLINDPLYSNIGTAESRESLSVELYNNKIIYNNIYPYDLFSSPQLFYMDSIRKNNFLFIKVAHFIV